jgi:hypothetical protein
MLATRLTGLTRLADPRYTAEPKLDGQRAQIHVRGGRAVGCYSRPGRDLLRHPGFVWLRDLTWPVDAAVFDGEACAGDGHEGIQAVFTDATGSAGTGRFASSMCWSYIGGRSWVSPGAIARSAWRTC